MKIKYYGLVSVIIIFISVLCSFFYVGYDMSKVGNNISIKRTPPAPFVNAPDAETLKDIKILSKKAEDLAFPHKKKITNTDISVFGYEPVYMNKNFLNSGKPLYLKTFKKNKYTLSFVMTSKHSDICKINGEIFKKDDYLPGGEKIIEIKNRSVCIATENIKRWLRIEE